MIGRAVGLASLAWLAGTTVVLAGPAAVEDKPPRTASSGSPSGGSDGAPLVVTMPDTQPALPSGMIEMDPSPFRSTGDADKLEPNIDGGSARNR